MCFFKCDLCENVDSHTLQEYSFSPVCIRIWLNKLQLFENADPHSWQENGFSLYDDMCLLNFELYENANPDLGKSKIALYCLDILIEI